MVDYYANMAVLKCYNELFLLYVAVSVRVQQVQGMAVQVRVRHQLRWANLLAWDTGDRNNNNALLIRLQ